MSLCLRLSGYVDWSWSTTFWPFWCLAALLIMVSQLILLPVVVFSIFLWIKKDTSFRVPLAAAWIFLIVVGYTAFTFIIFFDICIRHDYAYGREVPEDSDLKSTSIKFPWSADFPLIMLMVFACFQVISGFVIHSWLIALFKNLYKRSRVDTESQATEQLDNFEPSTHRVVAYKFKTPGIIKKHSEGEFYKKSDEHDVAQIRDKITYLKNRYRKKHRRYSVHVETITRVRDRQPTSTFPIQLKYVPL